MSGNENNASLTMSKDRTDQGRKCVKEAYGEELKFVEDKHYESSMPMIKDENIDNVRDVEEHVKNKLKKKRETTNVWFENSEGKLFLGKQIPMMKTN